MIFKYIKKSSIVKYIFAFNLENRDRWVENQSNFIASGSRILDVGAGSCPYRKYFSHCDYHTQDVAQLLPGQLRHGGYGDIDYISDATSIPVSDKSFDVVLCTEMLEHHPEPIRVVNELARVLKPGGILLLTAPLGSGIHQEPYHYYGGYTPYWYQRFLAQAGFKDITVTPNAGFFRFYAQESLRFLQLSNPVYIKANVLLRLLWAPVWLILLPIQGLLIPLIGLALDPWDRERRFTVGYHVKAIRSDET